MSGPSVGSAIFGRHTGRHRNCIFGTRTIRPQAIRCSLCLQGFHQSSSPYQFDTDRATRRREKLARVRLNVNRWSPILTFRSSVDIPLAEGPVNLNWGPIMKTINDSPYDFFRGGGWTFLGGAGEEVDPLSNPVASFFIFYLTQPCLERTG